MDNTLAKSNRPGPMKWAATTVMVFAILPLWMLTYPFDFGPSVITPWLQDPYPWVAKLNAMSNVIMFMPFGLFCSWWLISRGNRKATACVIVTLVAGAISLTGETLQLWLPDRHSSIEDVLANMGGALLGALLGGYFSQVITDRWQRASTCLADRPRSRAAVMMFIAMVVVRLAPFMFNVESYYLKEQWKETVAISWPPSFDVISLMNAAFTLVILTMMTLALSRALREIFELRGDRGNPAGLVVVIGLVLALSTELLQWPIRGRVMDVVDAAGAMAGVLVGLAVDTLLGPIVSRHR